MAKFIKVLPINYLQLAQTGIVSDSVTDSFDTYANTIPSLYKKITSGKMITVKIVSKHSEYNLINKWVATDLGVSNKGNQVKKFIKESYRHTNECDFIKSYLVYENEVPISVADLTDATKNEVALHYEVGSGDYNLEMVLAPARKEESSSYIKALSTLLEFMFVAAIGANRILLSIGKLSACNNWLPSLGFGSVSNLKRDMPNANLYMCTRESFLNTCPPLESTRKITEIRF